MSTLPQRGQGVNPGVLPHERPKNPQALDLRYKSLQTPMKTLVARYLERKATAKRREEAEKERLQLTYRGVSYCRPCPPCEVKIAYY